MTLAAGLLAGCATVEATRVASAPTALNVVSVNVSATAETGIVGRQFARSPEEIVSDVEAAVATALLERSDAAGTPVEVDIALGPVDLTNIAERALAQASSVTAIVSVTTVDGAAVLPSQEIVSSARGLRLPGVAGAISTPTVAQDYSNTITGFAVTLGNAIFPEV
ncbi:MAG: hypothetical protein AAGA70_07840 [Pseudomonadota bacterium]